MSDRVDSPQAGSNRFSIWRLLTWLILLLAVFGVLQYCMHAWRVAGLLNDATGTARHGDLVVMLAWDVAYLVAACLTVACAAGALLRRAWARPALRVVSGVLALWFLVLAVLLVARWSTFNHQLDAFMNGQGVDTLAHDMATRMRRQYQIVMASKVVAIPLLAWLCWHLGKPSVRAQFAARRRAQKG